jgi:hypothetical protein
MSEAEGSLRLLEGWAASDEQSPRSVCCHSEAGLSLDGAEESAFLVWWVSPTSVARLRGHALKIREAASGFGQFLQQWRWLPQHSVLLVKLLHALVHFL